VEASFKKLIKLQEIDAKIKTTSILIEKFPLQIDQIDKKIEESQQIVQDAKVKLVQNQKKRRDFESQAQDLKEKISKYKRQLNEVKTNKEYSSLLKEIEESQTKIDYLEEEIISEMLAADDIEKEIQQADQKLQHVQKELTQQKETIFLDKKKAEERKAELLKKKEELLPQIPGDQIRLYDSIFAKRDGIALSPVRDEFCTMCHMRVRPQMLNELIEENKIILCENCGRILYLLKKSA
jgi:hypothetical protein